MKFIAWEKNHIIQSHFRSHEGKEKDTHFNKKYVTKYAKSLNIVNKSCGL